MEESVFRPCLVMADEDGSIFDEEELLMVARVGADYTLPKPEDIMAMPKLGQVVLMPGRNAVGLDESVGQLEQVDALAVAVVPPPHYVITGHPATAPVEGKAPLPPLAYAAAGFGKNIFYMCARQLDAELVAARAPLSKQTKVEIVRKLVRACPQNPLATFFVEMYEKSQLLQGEIPFSYINQPIYLPLFPTGQGKKVFVGNQLGSKPILAAEPDAASLASVMEFYCTLQSAPVFVFGVLFAGEPLLRADVIVQALTTLREKGFTPKVHVRTNASDASALARLLQAGVSSVEVTVAGFSAAVHEAVTMQQGSWAGVLGGLDVVRAHAVPCALDVQYFAGVTDTEQEVDALIALVNQYGVKAVLLRNCVIDPDVYMERLQSVALSPSVGLQNLRKRIKKECQDVHLGHYAPMLFGK